MKMKINLGIPRKAFTASLNNYEEDTITESLQHT